MKRAGRKFDIYVIDAGDVERLHAWKSLEEVRFSYEDSRRLRRVRKRNNFLFDALADIGGYAYSVSEGVNEDMLLEAVVVNFRQRGEVRCQTAENGVIPGILPVEELERTLYEHGFHIAREKGEPVHFVPFVASASMSREEEYLFVNAERLDALLRSVSLDMVAAENGMPVLDGAPREDAGVFGGLQGKARVAAVPKLAAYLGLSLSDGVSLREICAAGKDPQDESAWLLGLNENNTVCVADWGNAPSYLEKFRYCWVNEEVPLEERTFLSRNVGGKQTELQKQLQALFQVLQGTDRSAFDARMKDQELSNRWQDAITNFFKLNMGMELRQGRIPRLQDSQQGTSVYQAATLYAACLYAEEGDFLIASGPVAKSDETVLTQKALLLMVERLFREERLRNHLWNMFHEQNHAVNHVVEATTDEQGVHLTLRLAPCTMFRTALRHVGWKHRHGKGQLYDGCGFLDDELFEQLEEMLGLKGKGLNAVQIRLPWCKGLLVRFTATQFFRSWAEQLGATVPGMTICDAFGRNRPLFDEAGKPVVKAFFTASMFKGKGWFGSLEDKSEPGHEGDRWAEYWRRLRAHRASLFIAGKNTPPGTTSRLNYQFLTTLGLGVSELHMLVERRLQELQRAIESDGKVSGERLAKLLMGLKQQEKEQDADLPETGDDKEPTTDAETDDHPDGPDEQDDKDDDDPDDEDEPDNTDSGAGEASGSADDAQDDYLTLLARALVAHPEALRSTALVKNRYASLVRSEVQHMMRGRLTVSGDVRYLVPDLMQMLRYIARKFLFLADGGRLRDREQGRSDLAAMSERRVSLTGERNANSPYGSYYAPGEDVPWTRRTGRLGKAGTLMNVAILRNPHYAQGEAPILSPLNDAQRGVYDQWFSHLTGCVMVPMAAMYTINGADCDGDRVNICCEPVVLTALRRRAKAENRLLASVIRNRGTILDWLKKEADACSNANVRRYWELLQETLPRVLPAPGDRPLLVCDSFPPLAYAGSAAVGSAFSREDLSGVHLRDKLWESFCMSRRQRIGQMSLQVLKLTPDAYGDISGIVPENMTPPQLLGCFLARYRLVSGALDTAMEIDMAKTGSVRKNQPMLMVPEEVRAVLGLRRDSGFYCWHTLCKKYQHALNGRDFGKNLESMMTEFSKGWTAPADGVLALDLLPMIVYHLFSPQKAALLSEPLVRPWKRKVAQAEEHSTVQAWMLGGAGHGMVRNVMRAPSDDELSTLKACAPGGKSLLMQLEEQLRNYDCVRRLHSRAQRANEGLDKAYQALLRWMLVNGFILKDALAGLDLLRGMIDRWHKWRPAHMKRLCDMFGMLRKLAREQSANVKWGWTADAHRRGGQLDAMLRTAYGVEGALPLEMQFTDAEKALLCCSRRSIVLVRLMAEFGRREALLQEQAEAGRALTPDELEAGMRATIAAAYPDDVDNLFRAACYELRGRHYTDASGKYCTMMSDFLMTYLLRTQLTDVIIDPGQERRKQQ